MAGYRRPVKIYRLKFEDPEMAGLEVAMRGLSVGALLDLSGLVAALQDGGAVTDAAAAGQLFGAFAERLVSWNLEDDQGRPVPADLDGVKTQELGFVLDVAMSWMEAVSSVAPPLPQPSSNGGMTPEGLGLAALSVSRGS